MGLGAEMIKQHTDMPADDLLCEVRAALNRISTAAANPYLYGEAPSVMGVGSPDHKPMSRCKDGVMSWASDLNN